MTDFIANYTRYHPVKTQRGLEILTGLFPWLLIAFLIIGSFFIPDVIAYLIIAFNIYWLYKSVSLSFSVISGYLNLRATSKIDWRKRLEQDPQTKDRYKQIYQIIIIPNVKEPTEILLRNVESISKQNFPLKNIFIVLAMEDREGEPARIRAQAVQSKFKNVFADIIATYHPLTVGETIGKHSNNTYAAKQVKKLIIDKRKIPLENIIVTSPDVDLVFDHQYFALTTYRFLTIKEPHNAIFQSALLAYNNIDRLPFLVRVPNILGSINNLAALQKPSGRVMNYSTYSLSFYLLDKVGYWDIDVIPEDWHINMKAYFILGGKLSIIPVYVANYLDAAESTSKWKTYQNYYEQVKRWAWGVVDIPYIIRMFIQHPEIPFWNKLTKISVALETHFSWSTSWFLITLGATIPTLLNPAFAQTTLGFNLSRVSAFILTLCLVGVFSVIVIDILLDPHKKRKFLSFIHPFTYLQWLIIPIIGLFFNALPGLESQTRLMLGKYMGYRVTEKVIK